MSMLRHLGGGAKGRIQPPARGTTSSTSTSDGPLRLKLNVPNYGILYLGPPDAPLPDGTTPNVPRDDPMLHGSLDIVLPEGTGARRCKSIRVGFKTVITLDLGTGRRYEEDVLFERKVEIISSTADGIWLSEGLQQFDFTIIVPANLASHDWHTNGVISHILYAEVEGLPSNNEWGGRATSPASSFFGLGLRRPNSRGASPRGGSPSRTPPMSPPLSPQLTRTPSTSLFAQASITPASATSPEPAGALASALANLSVETGSHARTTSIVSSHGRSPLGSPTSSATPIPIPMGGGTRPNPAHVSAAQSLSITRQEAPMLPRAPSYDAALDAVGDRSDWIVGTHRSKRNCMVVYNPSPTGGVNELQERANGYVEGLGVWELEMVSDVWSIGALLSFNLKIANLSNLTSVFSVKLILNQTISIISPRDIGSGEPRVSTRSFTVLEEGKRPTTAYPDRRNVALWRGKGAGGTDDADASSDMAIDKRCRLPDDNIARPSTLPGVVTPISVSHSLSLEVTFSVWGEDDRGRKMEHTTHGGLRALRVTRPLFVPSCCLVPAVLNLPSYEAHINDPLAPPPRQLPEGLPGWEWCACGWKIEMLEARMRSSVLEADTLAQRAARATSLSPEATMRVTEERVKLPAN